MRETSPCEPAMRVAAAAVLIRCVAILMFGLSGLAHAQTPASTIVAPAGHSSCVEAATAGRSATWRPKDCCLCISMLS